MNPDSLGHHSETPLSRLKLPKGIMELGRGTVFERVLEPDPEDSSADLLKEFGQQALKYDLDYCNDLDLNSPFPTLKEKMTDIYSNQVFKKVISCGSEKKVDGGSTVYYHYAAYQDGNDTPYDVSYLRRKNPLRSAIRSILPEGLQIGILNMTAEEESYILVHPELGFGRQGCSPRVQKDAWLLYRVKLFAVDKTVILRNEESTKSKPFNEILKQASDITEQGNNLKIQTGNTNEALKNYLYAVQILSSADPENENEIELRNGSLMRGGRNAMVCYNILKQFKEICELYNNLEKTLGHDIEDVKLLYLYGKALRMKGEDEEGLRVLKRALKLEPLNQSIIGELKEIENVKLRSKKLEKQMSGFLLKTFKKEAEKIETKPEVREEEAENDIFIMLRALAENDGNTSMVLPDLLIEEVNFCIEICEKLNLKYSLGDSGSLRIFK